MNLRALVYGMIVGLFVAAVLYFFVLERDADAFDAGRSGSVDQIASGFGETLPR
ncbi:MAG: hypothetical protein HOJ90_11970 [Alphaproteobacteria bacterium]|jgi:hypothetical protein|nr:hypothetical protein [Alphaproteobacteria bacterium]